MATTYPKDTQELLQALSFDKYYPEKLSINDLNEITELCIAEKESINRNNVGWHFINRLTRLNYDARYMKFESQSSDKTTRPSSYLQRRSQRKEASSKVFYPLDIATAAFLCCNAVAKQDLVKCLWSCKLAIPFVVQPDKSKSPEIFVWPLRSLIGQWQSRDDTASNEYPIFNYPMERVGFMRIGDLNESKSALLNGVIGGPEKAHTMFFHRDSRGSQKQRSTVVEGLIELGWYLPKGTEKDHFNRCMLFANLRGDASIHKEQTQFLLETMDTLVILSDTKNLLSNCELLQTAIKGPNKTLLVLTDLKLDDEEEETIDQFIESVGPDDASLFEIIPLEDNRLATKIELLNVQLSTPHTKTFTGLHDALEVIPHYCGLVDEKHDVSLIDGMKMANSILEEIEKTDSAKRKSTLLQVQGELWKQWTKAEKEIHRLDSFRKTDVEQDISSYRNLLEERKWELRNEQLQHFEKLPAFLKEFIRCLRDFDDSKLRAFLRMIKLGLDEITRSLLRPYYSNYMDIMSKKGDASEGTRNELQDQLDELDRKKVEFSIGIEHLIREIGQVFEASCDCDRQNDGTIALTASDSVACKELPYLASKLLLHGYPIELMDGDAGYVPEAWVRHVLASLQKHLTESDPTSQEPKIHVISVLGIQSSGKSTFLNTTFGLQFSVSAGCCTKGVFMQMLKVENSLRKKLGYDYVVAVDTEGLRSAKLSTQFDNELSFFAIGLSNTTVINLMGENVTYLEENLPIVVHAILRTNMSGLKPRCIIVHHNVNKRDKEKLMEQGRLLEKILNDLTAKACDIDRVPHRRFTEIIEFEIHSDTDYVPGYLEGEQPMGPISLGYSEECDGIRKRLLRHSATSSRRLTLKEFAFHLQCLCDAIKTNHFVFEFKSTRETLTRLHLDEQFSKLLRALLEDVSHISKSEKRNILQCANKTELENTFGDLNARVRRKIDKAGNDTRQELLTFLEGPGKSNLHIMLQWKEEIIQKFDVKLKKAQDDCIAGLEGLYEKQIFEFERSIPNIIRENDISRLKSIAKKTRTQYSRIQDVDLLADGMWRILKKEKESIYASQRNLTEQRVKGDVEKILFELCSAEKYLLEKALHPNKSVNKSVTDWSIKTVTVKDEYIKKRTPILCTKDTEIRDTVEQDLENLKIFLQDEIDSICTSENPYSKTQVERIILGAKHFIDRQKNNTTREFTVELYLSVAGSIVRELPHKQKLESRKSEEDMMQRQEKYMKPLLVNLLEKGTRASLIASGISTMVVEEVLKKTVTNLYEKSHCLTTYHPLSKLRLIKRLLRESVILKDYKVFESYRTDAKAAVEYMLARSLKTDKLVHAAMSEFKTLINGFLNYFRVHVPEEELSVAAHLKTSLCAIDILISKESENIIQEFRGDVLAVIDEVSRSLENYCQRDAEKDITSKISDKSDDIQQKCIRNFMQARFGCCAKCPFCNEVCMYGTNDHAGPHETTMHRPVACAGLFQTASGRRSLETCPNWIASDSKMEIGGKLIPFKYYKEVFPDWKIHGNPTLPASYIWKWFFFYHRKMLPGHWDIQVPSSWRIITESKVLHYLRSDTHTDV